jgi:hypothetical protein
MKHDLQSSVGVARIVLVDHKITFILSTCAVVSDRIAGNDPIREW